MMRDARILVWVLADPMRASQISEAQWEGITRIAEAEGLSDAVEACRTGETLADRPLGGELSRQICVRAALLLGAGALENGLREIWTINQMLRSGAQEDGFWSALLETSRSSGVTHHVSRALRLCYHLFETSVDPFLAWQGQRSDVFYVGRLLARNGRGEPTARWLRLAFRLRAKWLSWRHPIDGALAGAGGSHR
jgi:hypothetical protein